MTVKNDVAAKAAAEAARRAAEAAERKRAAEAQKKAAAALAAKSSTTKKPVADKATLAKRAGDKPSASAVRQAFGKDELSKGLGRALRQKSASLLGGPSTSLLPATRQDAALRRLANRSWDAGKLYTRSSLTADSAERKFKAESRQAAANTQADNDARQVQAARESYLNTCAQNKKDPGGNKATLANIDALDKTLAALPESQRPAFLASIKPELEQLVTDITALGKGDTKKAVAALAKCVDDAGPGAAQAITDPIAKAIANGNLEQKGDDADGGLFGVFDGANTHNSEREFIDGFKELIKNGQGELFQGSLVASLREIGGDRADGFAAAVATGKSDLVPDDGFWTGLRELPGDVVDKVEEIASSFIAKAHGWAMDRIDDILNTSEKIGELGPGDSLNLGVGFDATLGVSVGADAGVTVTCNDDGTYTVSGEVSADIGIGAGGDDEVGLGGKMSFTFATKEEAAKAANLLVGTGAAVAAPILAPALLPSPSELSNMYQHLSSVEVNASVAATFDAEAGTKGADFGASAGVEASTSYRIEFENGKPVAMVRVTEAQVSGSAGGPIDLIKDKVPGNIQLDGTAKVTGTVTVETRIPIDGSGVTDVGAFLLSPATAAFAGHAETTVTIAGDVEAGGNTGAHVEINVSGIDSSEVSQIAKGLFTNPLHAFEGVKVDVDGSGYVFADRGLDFKQDLTIAGEGIKFHVEDEIRDVSGQFTFFDDEAPKPAGGGGGGRVLRS